MPSFTHVQKALMVADYYRLRFEQNLNVTKAYQAVATLRHCCVNTVGDAVRKYNNGLTLARKHLPGSGRKRKLSDTQVTALYSSAKKYPKKPYNDLIAKHSLPICRSTAYNYLRRFGMRRYICLK